MGTKLKKMLLDVLPEEELQLLVGSFDVVGDIAIVIVPRELEHREDLIGRTILQSNAKIRVVAKRAGIYEGEFRTLPLQIIAGEKRKETVVREFGLTYMVNPETVYFSVRSGAERKRVATQVKDGEEVLVLFSGVAPYPLVISKFSKAKLIVGVEKNPTAHRYAQKNLEQNRKQNNIELYLGDASAVLERLKVSFDRVIMPLPKGGELFLGDVISVLKNQATLHFYQMKRKGEFHQGVDVLQTALEDHNSSMESASIIRCGHCGPRTYRICVDARVVRDSIAVEK